MFTKQTFFLLSFTTTALLFFVFLGTRNYEGNVSALLHMDVRFARENHVPAGIVLYEDGGYDGMAYYQIARDLPALFSGRKTSFGSAYRFQRILLPLLVYTSTLGNEHWFPFALLAINLAAAVGSLALLLSITKKYSLHAMTIVCNPAMLVGILYALTEPLSIFFMVAFFACWEKNDRTLNAPALGALLLSLLARETTVFLLGLLFLWFLWQKQWRQGFLLLIPLFLFVLWQYYLLLHFGSVAFQANSNIVNIPFSGALSLLQRLIQHTNMYVLSSLSLLLFLVVLCVALGKEWREKRGAIDMFCFILTGLCATMFMMQAHTWGAITSIGRIVTPLYPVYALYATKRDTWIERSLSIILILISVIAAIGIALVRHPFTIS